MHTVRAVGDLIEDPTKVGRVISDLIDNPLEKGQEVLAAGQGRSPGLAWPHKC